MPYAAVFTFSIVQRLSTSRDNSATLGHMKQTTYELRWNPTALAKLFSRKKIQDRTDLARAVGISRACAYRTFDTDWTGRATSAVLAQIAGVLNVSPATLVETTPVTAATSKKRAA
ncbi:transcriptional repressor [Mycobacterium phage Aminay]|uniref:Helix-turn-helix DNA binding domain protein n=1 Tax=Mycobacterium phage Aminay TaxID=2250291 RepID=A0A345KV33_9CAUD|nr:transcriptional repressor [Mycobacterium phage Aminay]AXH46885.1 helix-turn-helix DNA binding domain protein [Mycobacterium phage Aminay]